MDTLSPILRIKPSAGGQLTAVQVHMVSSNPVLRRSQDCPLLADVRLSEHACIPKSRTEHANTNYSQPGSWEVELLEGFIVEALFGSSVAGYCKVRDYSNAEVHDGEQEEPGSPIKDLCKQPGQDGTKDKPQWVASRECAERFILSWTGLLVYGAQHALSRGNSSG
jgi:hypothetical protein